MGAIADVVPNHVAVPTPARLNKALWSVLRDGPSSPYAEWFDVDWGAGNQPLLMAVLGQRIGKVLADGELSVDGDDAAVLRPRVPAAARHGEPADRGAGHRAVVPPGALAGRRRGAELPALLRRRHAGRCPGGGPGGLRRHARAAARVAARGKAQRLPHRPPGRSGRSARLPAPAGRAHGRCLGRGGEDPRGRRASCPPTGPAPAPPGTTRCCGSAASSSTRPARRRWPRSTRSSPASRPTSRRSWSRPSARWSSTASTPRSTGWWSSLARHLPGRRAAARPHPAGLPRGASSSCWSRSTGTARTSYPGSSRPHTESHGDGARRRAGPRATCDEERQDDARRWSRDLVARPRGRYRGPDRRATRGTS